MIIVVDGKIKICNNLLELNQLHLEVMRILNFNTGTLLGKATFLEKRGLSPF